MLADIDINEDIPIEIINPSTVNKKFLSSTQDLEDLKSSVLIDTEKNNIVNQQVQDLQKEFENVVEQKQDNDDVKNKNNGNEQIEDIDLELDLEMMEEDVFTSLQNQEVV